MPTNYNEPVNYNAPINYNGTAPVPVVIVHGGMAPTRRRYRPPPFELDEADLERYLRRRRLLQDDEDLIIAMS